MLLLRRYSRFFSNKTNKLSHVTTDNLPTMVNIHDKKVTFRQATAQSKIQLPSNILSLIKDNEIHSKKGPVIATAIIAGTQAVKSTSSIIPFCHPLPIEKCSFDINIEKNNMIIQCQVAVNHKTGVEMEALTGASVAALTVYDMCKALSHKMIITDTKLLKKSGGKSNFLHNET